jgi:hypothetical protein
MLHAGFWANKILLKPPKKRILMTRHSLHRLWSRINGAKKKQFVTNRLLSKQKRILGKNKYHQPLARGTALK